MKEDTYSLSIRCLNPLRYGHSRGKCCGSRYASFCSITHSYSLCYDMSEDNDYIISLLDALAKENKTTHLVDDAKEFFLKVFQDARIEAEEQRRTLESKELEKKASKKKQTGNSRTRLDFRPIELQLYAKLKDLCNEHFFQENMTIANKIMNTIEYPKYGVGSLRLRQHHENSPSNRKKKKNQDNDNDNDKEKTQSKAILNRSGSETPSQSPYEVIDCSNLNKEAAQGGVCYGHPESPNPFHNCIAIPRYRYGAQELLQSAENKSASPESDELLPCPISFDTHNFQDSLLSLEEFPRLQNENGNKGVNTVDDSGIESNEIAYK